MLSHDDYSSGLAGLALGQAWHRVTETSAANMHVHLYRTRPVSTMSVLQERQADKLALELAAKNSC